MLIYIYMLLTLAMGASALWKGAIYPGIAGIIGLTLCWFAASGLRPQGLIVGWDFVTETRGLGSCNRVRRRGHRNRLSLGLLGRVFWLRVHRSYLVPGRTRCWLDKHNATARAIGVCREIKVDH